MRGYVFWFVIGCFAIYWLTNALIMIVSPARWYKLPTWMIGVSGEKYGKTYSHGRGAVEMRVLGVMLFVVPLWIFLDITFRK